MPTYQKIGTEWVPTKRPYIKKNGVWTPVRTINVKDGGVWKKAYEYDTTPPAPPEIGLQLMPASSPRYIRVNVHLPGLQHDPDVKRIRILASRTAMPSSPLGAGYVSGVDKDFPKESWSDWYYNLETGDYHGNTNEIDHKQYPLNPTDSTNLPGAQYYYFAGWSQDFAGNWSSGTFTKIWMPKEGVAADKVVLKEASFQANYAGSVGGAGGNYNEGKLVVRHNPMSNGVWFHGYKINEAIGAQGKPTIKSAKIRMTRRDDSGKGSANVRLFWHKKNHPNTLPIPSAERFDTTLLGTINKGETKWFNLPSSFWPKLTAEAHGFGLLQGPNAGDFLEVVGLGNDPRSGELRVVWEEAL